MIKLSDYELKNVCKIVDFVDTKSNLKLAQELFKLMVKENGIGLAANQAGISKRVFVMSVNKKAYHCFNPEITKYGIEEISYNEGCLSFPNQRCDIIRCDKILVKYYNAYGIETNEWLDGLASRCFQHELDHLNGLTMFDRIRPR